MSETHIGFIGAGGIARAHAYALDALKFYYEKIPEIRFASVTSRRKESRDDFAEKFGVECAQDIDSFSKNEDIDTVLILGPNKVHYEHLLMALEMPAIRHIYLEKPVCASVQEEQAMRNLLHQGTPGKKIQVGFQFLQSPSFRDALNFWKSGVLGRPIHFEIKYYHGDYLRSSYREKRVSRLTPAPDGGAMADLGSHVISMAVAFFGESLQVLGGIQGGGYNDVPGDSDLFSSIALFDPGTRAVGNLSASRISAGTGDWINLELYAEKGTLKYSTLQPDYYEYFLETGQNWIRVPVGSNYRPVTSFPSGHVPAGWLRSLLHAHYIFLTGDATGSFIPDLGHGLVVQRIVRETAEHLHAFRNRRDE